MKKPAMLLFALVSTVAFSTSAWASKAEELAQKRANLEASQHRAAPARAAASANADPGVPVTAELVDRMRAAKPRGNAGSLMGTAPAKQGGSASLARSGSTIQDIQVEVGDTTGAPTWNRPVTLGALSGVGTATPYVFSQFTVSANDSCDINSVQAGWDGYLHLYEISFDPLDQLTNIIALNDDGFGGVGTSDITGQALNAGTTYFLVTSGFGNADDGPFTNTIDCPVANVNLGAGVTLTTAGSTSPVLVAQELIIPPDRPIVNSGAFNVSTQIGYAFSPGEVRYARLSCPGVELTTASVIDFTGDPSNTIGAVNGAGSDAIFFSITAGATPVVATDGFTVDGDRTLAAKAPVDCTYGLYDFPSQAQAGGTSGRVATTSGQYVRFGPSYALSVNNNEDAVADVESNDPAYSEFVNSATTFGVDSAQIGGLSMGNIFDVNGTRQPITLDGDAIDMADLMSLNAALTFQGDFSGAGLVYFSFSPDCSTLAASLDAWDDTSAIYAGWNFTEVDLFLCYFANGVPMPASDFTVTFEADSADPTTYAVSDIGPEFLGQISRNGAELQAPLAQVPAGYLSRMVLTNTGSQARDYVIEVLGETGNVISTANLTGTVPAAGTLVVDLNSVLTGFTASPRATLNVTVSGPNKQIQGLYQIVNPNSGTVSNHVMVRPGTN